MAAAAAQGKQENLWQYHTRHSASMHCSMQPRCSCKGLLINFIVPGPAPCWQLPHIDGLVPGNCHAAGAAVFDAAWHTRCHVRWAKQPMHSCTLLPAAHGFQLHCQLLLLMMWCKQFPLLQELHKAHNWLCVAVCHNLWVMLPAARPECLATHSSPTAAGAAGSRLCAARFQHRDGAGGRACA